MLGDVCVRECHVCVRECPSLISTAPKGKRVPVTLWMELLAVLILAGWTNKSATGTLRTWNLQVLTLEKVQSQMPHFLSRGSRAPSLTL